MEGGSSRSVSSPEVLTYCKIELVSRDFDFQVDETADLQLSDDSVIQPSLVPLLPLQPHFDSTSELSLLKIKLTVANSQTAIGICWHRTLGNLLSKVPLYD